MMQKLRQQNGETLIEAMISLLIAVMCMGILSISVTTASKANLESSRLDETYSTDLQIAEQHDETYGVTDAEAKIEFADSTISTVQISIDVYGGEKEEHSFASYTKKR